MNFDSPSSREQSLYDESFVQHPDFAEQTVLAAVRTWLRPQCDVVRRSKDWHDVLHDAGMTAEGIGYFDTLMRALMCASCRPLDTRCRCATDLAKDEGSLLQIIALLQRTSGDAAMQILNDWLPPPTVSRVLKIVRWFAISLLDAGLVIQVRVRRVTYMH
ncbi:MAG TPA: hypothetical protein VEI25_15215 [Paraburkholderia sp.]|nr:hypothetical protein [Paraburkholderia sp.]